MQLIAVSCKIQNSFKILMLRCQEVDRTRLVKMNVSVFDSNLM